MNDTIFLKVSSNVYEDLRDQIDKDLGLSDNETFFEPINTALKTPTGDVLLTIRNIHFNNDPYKTVIENIINNNKVTQITQEEFASYLPQEE